MLERYARQHEDVVMKHFIYISAWLLAWLAASASRAALCNLGLFASPITTWIAKCILPLGSTASLRFQVNSSLGFSTSIISPADVSPGTHSSSYPRHPNLSSQGCHLSLDIPSTSSTSITTMLSGQALAHQHSPTKKIAPDPFEIRWKVRSVIHFHFQPLATGPVIWAYTLAMKASTLRSPTRARVKAWTFSPTHFI